MNFLKLLHRPFSMDIKKIPHKCFNSNDKKNTHSYYK